MYEYPNEVVEIDVLKIIPPYKSDIIPIVEQKEYCVSETRSGWNRIDRSMRIDHSQCPGMYDCTRYYYDYNRNNTKKIERIGKKYQWIAFYNILARVSDVYSIKEWGRMPYAYSGPWEPYVRDFDPTLNRNTWKDVVHPRIHYPETGDEFLNINPFPDDVAIHNWKNEKPEFFTRLPEKLIVDDDDHVEWLVLYLHENKENMSDIWDSSSIGTAKGSQKMWLMVQAFFVHTEQFPEFIEKVSVIKGKEYSEFDGRSEYALFNGEYAWSPGYKAVFKEKWNKCEIDTGKYRTVKEIYEMPDFENIQYDETGKIMIPMVEKEFEKQIPEDVIVVDVMPAYSTVLWEEQYDASQEETTSFNIPCGDIIEHFRLKQKDVDGYYYSQEDILVCFDGDIAGIQDGLFIRKEYLDKYLQENNLRLCWKCIGEKQYFHGDMNQTWSRWNGIQYYDNGNVCGEFQSDEEF